MQPILEVNLQHVAHIHAQHQGARPLTVAEFEVVKFGASVPVFATRSLLSTNIMPSGCEAPSRLITYGWSMATTLAWIVRCTLKLGVDTALVAVAAFCAIASWPPGIGAAPPPGIWPALWPSDGEIPLKPTSINVRKANRQRFIAALRIMIRLIPPPIAASFCPVLVANGRRGLPRNRPWVQEHTQQEPAADAAPTDGITVDLWEVEFRECGFLIDFPVRVFLISLEVTVQIGEVKRPARKNLKCVGFPEFL